MIILKTSLRFLMVFWGVITTFGMIGPAVGHLAVTVTAGFSVKDMWDTMRLGYFVGIVPAVIGGVIDFISVTYLSLKADDYEFPDEGLLWGIGAFSGLGAFFVSAAIFSFPPFTEKSIKLGLVCAFAGAVCGRLINGVAWKHTYV